MKFSYKGRGYDICNCSCHVKGTKVGRGHECCPFINIEYLIPNQNGSIEIDDEKFDFDESSLKNKVVIFP